MIFKRTGIFILCVSLLFQGTARPVFAAENDEVLAAEPPQEEAPADPSSLVQGFEKIKDSLAADFQKLPSRTTAGVSDINYIAWPTTEGEKSKPITVFQSTSQILRFDRPLTRVAVSDTSVCDITTLGTQEVLIYCTRPGLINLLAWDMNFQIAIYDIQATIDYKKLQEILTGIDAESQITIVPYGDSIAVHGSASTIEKVRKMEEAIRIYNPRGISYIRVVRPKQIMLEVRFAEIDRRASREYGLDAEAITRYMTARSFTGEATAGTVSDSVTFTPPGAVGATSPIDDPAPALSNEFFRWTQNDFKIQAFLRWLATKNILKLTARPNVIALDGEEASFVVGGESPYITSTDTSVNVAFKEFGTKLTFRPTVMDNQQIRLQMRIEVSELDFSTTVSLQGTTVPTVVKTTHQTVAELGDNETMVVGGLVNQRINRVEKKVPFFGSIPGLQKLLSRMEYERKDVELLIVCTPHLIEPFPNPDKKQLYPPRDVMEATSVYVPSYPDLHGDMINRILVQDERYHDFDGFTIKRAKEIEDEFVRIKKRDSIMDKALHAATGFKGKEEIEPYPKSPEPIEDSELFSKTFDETSAAADPLTAASVPAAAPAVPASRTA